MGSLAVLDRTNVSAAQDTPPKRLQSESLWYARVGHATLFGPEAHYGASFGFGYRAEFDRIGLDFSFLNVDTSGSGSYASSGGSAISFVKLEGLYFVSPTANHSAYFGGGLSYGRTELRGSSQDIYRPYGNGSGLQAELSAGYEIARVTSVRRRSLSRPGATRDERGMPCSVSMSCCASMAVRMVRWASMRAWPLSSPM